MTAYRAYFLSASDHIRDVRALPATDDATARADAQFMLAQSEYAAIEIYDGRRLVCRQERAQQAA